jgi:hypothetical protein
MLDLMAQRLEALGRVTESQSRGLLLTPMMLTMDYLVSKPLDVTSCDARDVTNCVNRKDPNDRARSLILSDLIRLLEAMA